jgi:hypothetical protein
LIYRESKTKTREVAARLHDLPENGKKKVFHRKMRGWRDEAKARQTG